MVKSANVRHILEKAKSLDGDELKELLADLLSLIHPRKFQGTKLCNALTRLKPAVAFEALHIRGSGKDTEVYLTKRPPDDIAHPNEWCAPSSIYRQGEHDQDVAKRLEEDFFHTGIKSFHFVSRFPVHHEERGTVHSNVFLVDLVGQPLLDLRHDWHPISKLPESIVPHHSDPIIPLAAVAHHKRNQSGQPKRSFQ